MNRLFVIGLALVFAGFFIMAVVPLLQVQNAQVATAGCVFLFFVPICFGVGQPQLMGVAVLATAVILAVLFLLAVLLFLRRPMQI